MENDRTKTKDLDKKNFVLEDKSRQWKERFDKLVNYLRNKVTGLFGNKDFLSTNDYNNKHMKPVIKKVEIKEEKEQNDDFDIECK